MGQFTEAFIGEIRLWAGNFEPQGWKYCGGQLLAIADFQALYSIIGDTYGGNGRDNFQLPDLRSRVPVQAGQGQGLRRYNLGEFFGADTMTLTELNLPPHTHMMRCDSKVGDQQSPVNHYPADEGNQTFKLFSSNPDSTMGEVTPTGQGRPFENHQPSLAMNYIIAVDGLYPPRS